MQIKYLFGRFNSWIEPENPSPEALVRLKVLEKVARLKASGCTKAVAIKEAEISSSSFYRNYAKLKNDGIFALENKSRRPKKLPKPCWSQKQKDLILKIRRANPLWGKGRWCKAIKSAAFYNGQKNVKPRIF